MKKVLLDQNKIRMNIFLWILFGGIAGWIASMMVGTDATMGVAANVVVGIAGAFVGGWLSNIVGLETEPGSGAERPTQFISFAWAVVGATILLLGLNLLV